jgi:predicted ATP-grasp superfamily ATP-dependent carboligase
MTGINRMSSASTVLVYEFFTGGGSSEGEMPGGLAAEALGMLWAVLQDFRQWGAVRTITALDPRFEQRVPGLCRETLPADEVIRAGAGDHEEVYLSLLKRCDAVLVIAPETDGILSRLAEQAETEGIPLLGSSAAAVATAGNKAVCSRLFDLANLPAPKARTATFSTAAHVAAQMGCPLIIKPIDGVGCDGVCQLNSLSDLPEILALIRPSTTQEQLLLQSLVSGTHASVSLLVAEGGCLPLSLNLQLIEAGAPFQYLGSRVPFQHPLSDQALELASSAVDLIPGLKGYVGVDLVLAEDHAELIEINPRITTSYIGLRQVTAMNLAQAIWDACMNGVLPDCFPLKGEVIIRKDDPGSWGFRSER